MSDRLPYEEQLPLQWNNIPLSDENIAWADMKRRLEENDDNPLLPFWLRGCAGWALLGLLLTGLGWAIFHPEKWFNNKQGSKQINATEEKKSTVSNNTIFRLADTSTTLANNNTVVSNEMIKADSSKTAMDNLSEKKSTNIKMYSENDINVIRPGIAIKGGKEKNKTKTNKLAAEDKPWLDIKSGKGKMNKQLKDSAVTTTLPNQQSTDSSISIIKKITQTDTFLKIKTDTVTQNTKEEPILAENKPKTDSSKKKSLIFSTGIGLQQQLPVAGQKLTPYNLQGRKGSLADYIPSVYFRMTKPGKWFFQTEVRYGAPQYTKEFTYRQIAVPDTGANPRFTTITSSRLKKTFYHQLPLTFNYFIRKSWSIGIGIQWNKFYAAVSEREIIQKNNFTQVDSFISKNIINIKKDSASEFKKSYWQAVFEMQYKWKRFSFGARYSFGLQPYIQFTLPGTASQKEKNNSLQLFIRYELWRSKNK